MNFKKGDQVLFNGVTGRVSQGTSHTVRVSFPIPVRCPHISRCGLQAGCVFPTYSFSIANDLRCLRIDDLNPVIASQQPFKVGEQVVYAGTLGGYNGLSCTILALRNECGLLSAEVEFADGMRLVVFLPHLKRVANFGEAAVRKQPCVTTFFKDTLRQFERPRKETCHVCGQEFRMSFNEMYCGCKL